MISADKKIYQTSWLLWILYLLILSAIIIFSHHPRSVTPNYYQAAQHWLSGSNLYNGTGTGFIYFPQAAILYIPFSIFPFKVSEILWRVFSLSLLIYSFFQFSKQTNPKFHSQVFLVFTILSLLLGFDSARNGQFNLVLSAFMLFACSAFINKHYFKTALFLVLGFAFKPTMIVFLLTLSVLFLKVGWRSVILLALFVLLPFLLQVPHYVLQQYHAAYYNLIATANLGNDTTQWSQVFGMLRQMGWVDTPPLIATLARMVMAFFTFCMCWKIKNRYSIEQALFWIYSFCCCYLLLFNPRTENNDYILLAPTLAYFILGYIRSKNYPMLTLFLVLTLMMLFSFNLSLWFFYPYKSVFAPLATIILSGFLYYQFFRQTLKNQFFFHEDCLIKQR